MNALHRVFLNALLGSGWTAFLLLGIVGTRPVAVHASDSFEIRVYMAEKTRTPLRIDGKLDEPAWKKAPAAGGFTFYDRPVKVTPQTFLKVTYDDKNLYFGIRCDEPLMKKVHPMAQARDAHAVFGGETIEFFIDPKHDHGNYYQLAVNAAASMYDSRREDKSWNCGMRAAAHLETDAWFLELAVPWKDLDIAPTPGRIIGFNVCRDRQVGGKQWTNWSQTRGGFHDPIHFAHLILWRNGLSLKGFTRELRKGDRNGPIVLFTRQGFGGKSYHTLALASLKQLDSKLGELQEQVQREKSPATRKALQAVLDGIRRDAAPLRKLVSSRKELDAKTWTDLDRQITHWLSGLDRAVWKARLDALLSEI